MYKSLIFVDLGSTNVLKEGIFPLGVKVLAKIEEYVPVGIGMSEGSAVSSCCVYVWYVPLHRIIVPTTAAALSVALVSASSSCSSLLQKHWRGHFS